MLQSASIGWVSARVQLSFVGNSGAEPMPVAKLAYGLVRRFGTASCVSLKFLCLLYI